MDLGLRDGCGESRGTEFRQAVHQFSQRPNKMQIQEFFNEGKVERRGEYIL